MSVSRKEIAPGILELMIDRPTALNALNLEVIESLISELKEIQSKVAKTDSPKVITIKGGGEKAFVAGADIAVLKNSSGDSQNTEAERFIEKGVQLMEEIEACPLPVIACVDGFCLGGGLELALSCDIIVATERSKFGLSEITLGLIPGFGGTQRLPRRVGIGTARRIIFSGEMIAAADAEKIGLVDYVTDQLNFSETALKVSKQLAERSSFALEAAKNALKAADDLDKQTGLSEEKKLFLNLLKTEDAREGLSAFLEKRKPNFKGR